jgi:dienelactone hydrolase
MKLRNLDLIVQGKRFKTEKATPIAHQDYGSFGSFLLRTDKGTYFIQHQDDSQGKRDRIQPISWRWTMKLQSFSVPSAARRYGVRWRLVLLVAAAALVVSSLGAAQTDAPGEPVTIAGTEISGWGQVNEVPARFGRPAGSTPKVPAVLILHGSGVDGRGAFYAKALQEAGIATLEITMFPPGGRPKAGPQATMPHAAAALRWLAAQPTVDGQRLGVMGFSWGAGMTMMMSSELVQERLGKDVPKPAAFAPFYPVCSNWIPKLVDPKDPFYNAHTQMSTAPMLIHKGTRDDYEEGERPCDALVAMWPPAAREHTTVRYVEGATHGFDGQKPMEFKDEFARGRGGRVSVIPSPRDAAEARQAVVSFFVKHLKP